MMIGVYAGGARHLWAKGGMRQMNLPMLRVQLKNDSACNGGSQHDKLVDVCAWMHRRE